MGHERHVGAQWCFSQREKVKKRTIHFVERKGTQFELYTFCLQHKRDVSKLPGMTVTRSKPVRPAGTRPKGRRSLADAVIQRLRQEIISGRMAPGTMVAEIPTAQRLDVSRVPVREALMVLEQDGLLVCEDNGRCRVRTLTTRDFDEIYGVRLMLESESFRLAATAHTQADLQSLRDNLRQMARAKSLHRVTVLDIEFHDRIMQISRQSRLMHLWRVMLSQIQLFTATLQREISSVSTNVQDVSLEAHEHCLRGIESGDPDLARRCAIDHLEPWNEWLKSTRPESRAL